jgi:hypothetical protein
MKDTNNTLNAVTRLFRVKVTYETVIYAESEEEALGHVTYGMSEIDDTPQEVKASPINDISDLPGTWSEKCLPWGNTLEDKNIAKILSEMEGGSE